MNPIPVMDIPIKNEYPICSTGMDGMFRGHGHIVEETKTLTKQNKQSKGIDDK